MDKRYEFILYIEFTYCKHFLLFTLGPELPYRLKGSTMVSSPTDKGVVIIGGYDVGEKKWSKTLFELSGDSVESLKWKKLDQKLQYPRDGHVSFLIPNTCNPY